MNQYLTIQTYDIVYKRIYFIKTSILLWIHYLTKQTGEVANFQVFLNSDQCILIQIITLYTEQTNTLHHIYYMIFYLCFLLIRYYFIQVQTSFFLYFIWSLNQIKYQFIFIYNIESKYRLLNYNIVILSYIFQNIFFFLIKSK